MEFLLVQVVNGGEANEPTLFPNTEEGTKLAKKAFFEGVNEIVKVGKKKKEQFWEEGMCLGTDCGVYVWDLSPVVK